MNYSVRILLSLVLCARLVLPVWGAEPPAAKSPPLTLAPASAAAKPAKPVRAAGPLAPGPNDWRIALMTSQMLEQFHYLHLPFNRELSGKFFDMYINTLDPQHIHFFQSDLAEFAPYRTNLNVLTKRKHDTSPAFVIFNRYLQRLEERTAYSRELLAHDPFDFSGNDKISSNRKQAPFPADMAEARQLWRERVRYEYLQEKLNKESQREIVGLISTRHDPASLALMPREFHESIIKIISNRYTRTLKNFEEWDGDKVLEVYLSALAHVYDPHSDYEDREDLENFSILMSLSLFGIGAVLTTTDDGMYCKIRDLNPSGPASKSKKLHAGDRIVAVAQGTNEPVDVVDMPLDKTVELIRGPKGTEVRLTLIPATAVDPSTRVTISLIRDEIKLEESQAKAKIIEMPGKNGEKRRLGVINLPSFYASFRLIGSEHTTDKSATVDVARLLEKLNAEKVSGVILDLRHNGGGSLEEAIDLTGLFIRDGPVVGVKSADTNEPVRWHEDRDPAVQYDGPLIVLTDHFSASASEILAGALQDYGRALVVGDVSTHGKGTVQSMTQLAPYIFAQAGLDVKNVNPTAFGALRYTTNKFYRISGGSTQLKGVVPDIVLPSTDDYLEGIGERSLDNPLAYDEITPADYEKLNRVKPYLPELEKRSDDRVAASKDYDYVREDIEQVKKIMAEKNISLNEPQRLSEKATQEARQRAREQELKSRKFPEQKIYDLTLKDEEVLMKEETNAQLAASSSVEVPGTFGTSHVASHQLDVKPGNKSETGIGPSSSTNVEEAKKSLTLAHNNDTPPAVSADADADEPAPEDKVPQVDVNLNETESILSDYIRLLHSEPPLTAEHN